MRPHDGRMTPRRRRTSFALAVALLVVIPFAHPLNPSPAHAAPSLTIRVPVFAEPGEVPPAVVASDSPLAGAHLLGRLHERRRRHRHRAARAAAGSGEAMAARRAGGPVGDHRTRRVPGRGRHEEVGRHRGGRTPLPRRPRGVAVDLQGQRRRRRAVDLARTEPPARPPVADRERAAPRRPDRRRGRLDGLRRPAEVHRHHGVLDAAARARRRQPAVLKRRASSISPGSGSAGSARRTRGAACSSPRSGTPRPTTTRASGTRPSTTAAPTPAAAGGRRTSSPARPAGPTSLRSRPRPSPTRRCGTRAIRAGGWSGRRRPGSGRRGRSGRVWRNCCYQQDSWRDDLAVAQAALWRATGTGVVRRRRARLPAARDLRRGATTGW